VESKRNAVKGEWQVQDAQLKSPMVWGSLWLLCGSSQAGGRNVDVSTGGVRVISRFNCYRIDF
jgi:hypothetical protein